MFAVSISARHSIPLQGEGHAKRIELALDLCARRHRTVHTDHERARRVRRGYSRETGRIDRCKSRHRPPVDRCRHRRTSQASGYDADVCWHHLQRIHASPEHRAEHHRLRRCSAVHAAWIHHRDPVGSRLRRTFRVPGMALRIVQEIAQLTPCPETRSVENSAPPWRGVFLFCPKRLDIRHDRH